MITPHQMDRLSNWLGAFIPGCSHLPTRHPVKVSLVMGLLGLIAGWLTMGTVLGLEKWVPPNSWKLNLIPGTFLGLLVYIPLMLWQGRSAAVVALAVLLAMAAGFAHVSLLELIGPNGPNLIGIAVAGFVAGIGYIVCGLIPNRRRDWRMLIPVPLLSAALHGGIVFFETSHLRSMLPSPFEWIFIFMIVANLFAWLFAGVGITFGTALWDRTPKPKFEPAEE